MRAVLAVIFTTMLSLLAGCALLGDDNAGSAALPAPAVFVAPPPSPETDLPQGRAPALTLPPASKAPAPRATLPTRQEPSVIKHVEPMAAPAAGPPPTPPAAVTKPVIKISAPANPGPAWLKGCQHRQQQGNVILCDADTLLAEPSDKVMVYVREPKLSRSVPGGHSIVLRESLPRRYRLYVME